MHPTLLQRALLVCTRLCGLALIVYTGYRPLELFWYVQANPIQELTLETNLVLHAVSAPLIIGLGVGLLLLQRWSLVVAMLLSACGALSSLLAFLINAFFTPLWIEPVTHEWVRWHPNASLLFLYTFPFALLFYFTWKLLGRDSLPVNKGPGVPLAVVEG